MNQWLGLVISYAFVFAVIGVSGVLVKKNLVSGETGRKIVHIGVSNWIILALFLFRDWYFAIVGPVTFVILNFLSWKFNLFKGMEGGDKSPGTVFFAVSLTLVTWFFWWRQDLGDLRYIALLAMLTLGWGDGLAAVAGHRWGRTKTIGGKTLAGSVAMFIVSTTVLWAVLALMSPWSIATAALIALGLGALATLVEMLLPAGWDNLGIPLAVAGAYYGWYLVVGGLF